MPVALIVGPLAALVGLVAIFFVLRRKSVDKRSMYSARRSQIEHKVRAARQRTLAPRGKPETPAQVPSEPAPTSIFAPAPSAPRVTYETSTYAPAPPAPPAPPPAAPAPPVRAPQEPAQWDVGPPAPAPSQFSTPEAPPAPPSESVWTPASAPPEPAPIEPPAWTPAPAPAEPATPIEPVHPAIPAASPTAWSVVSEAKESAEVTADQPRKKGELTTPAWQLASGEEPGMEADEAVKPPSPVVAIAQYAVLVVGLVMVLIGVLVMVANSRSG